MGWTTGLLLLSLAGARATRLPVALSFLGWGPQAILLPWLLPRRRFLSLVLTSLAVPLALTQALWCDDSLARREFLFRCKAAQVQRGRLSYCHGWEALQRIQPDLKMNVRPSLP